MATQTQDFLKDCDIVNYFSFFKPTFEIDEIPKYIRGSAYQQIVARSGTSFDNTTRTITINGDGTPYLSILETPITITALSILNHNASSEDIDLNVDPTSDEKNIVYNPLTGLIQYINGYNLPGYPRTTRTDCDEDTLYCFPRGIQNIQVTGTFGGKSGYNCILAQLQLYLMNIQMARLNPQIYGKPDMVSEKIGKYSYEMYGRSQTKAERSTLEQLVDQLFNMLPGSACFGDI